MGPSEHHQAPGAALKVARIYMRVSTEDQDLNRQDTIVESTKTADFYIAGLYREKANGAQAERMVASTRAKGARLAVPGVVDLTELAAKLTPKCTIRLLHCGLRAKALLVRPDSPDAAHARSREFGRFINHQSGLPGRSFPSSK